MRVCHKLEITRSALMALLTHRYPDGEIYIGPEAQVHVDVQGENCSAEVTNDNPIVLEWSTEVA